MSLSSKFRHSLFHLLEILPTRLGFFIYHFIQEIIGNKNLPHKLEAAYTSYRKLQQISEESGVIMKDRTILEIGSGWLPLMPYFFKYFGNARIIRTYDLNKHYPKAIKEINHLFYKKFGFSISNGGNKYNLPKGITYYPHTDLTKEKNLEADIVFSRFVLEHITPNDLKKIHQKLKSNLKPGAHIIHFISPSDHRAYNDPSLSLQDFLKYSPQEWAKVHTKFDYHNRWRLPQHIDLFEESGFKIVKLHFDVPDKKSDSYKKFKSLNLHADYKNFSEEELMAGSINIVLRV